MVASVEAPEAHSTTGSTRLRFLVDWLRSSEAVRAGAFLAVSTLVLNGAAYLYNVACIRYLGPPGYGDVATMLALTTIVALPLGSVQTVIAREVAQLSAVGTVSRILRRSLAVATGVACAVLALGLVLLSPIQEALNIGSEATVAAGLSGIVFAVLAAVLYGFLQGAHRFHALGVSYAVSGIARVTLVVPALLLGLGAAGALGVNAVAGAIAVLIAGVALASIWRIRDNSPLLRIERWPVASTFIGSLAFAFLTNADVVLASYFLDDEASGIYAAASLLGKAVLFLPSAVVIVLLPKAATRAATGRRSEGILLASAGVTLALSLTSALLLALVPESLLTWAFGPAFRESTALLGWFGLAMSAAALVSVYLSVYLAERNTRFPMLVALAALAQVLVVSAWHPDPRSIVLVTLGCCVTVLAIHELAFPHALIRILRDQRVGSAA
jgi:O-antigen/teichoic acid export membrane protein